MRRTKLFFLLFKSIMTTALIVFVLSADLRGCQPRKEATPVAAPTR